MLMDEGGSSVTTAADVFSLGCVYYYVLSRGWHPYGDALRRQANIVAGQFALERLKHDGLIGKVVRHSQMSRNSPPPVNSFR